MTIVIGYDGSEPAKRTLERVAQFATADGNVVVVSAAEFHARAVLTEGAQLDPSAVRRAREAVAEAKASLAERGIDADTVVAQGDPGDVIVDVADERGADLIAVGHRGHRLEQLVLGSVTTKVVHRAHCDVLVVH